MPEPGVLIVSESILALSNAEPGWRPAERGPRDFVEAMALSIVWRGIESLSVFWRWV